LDLDPEDVQRDLDDNARGGTRIEHEIVAGIRALVFGRQRAPRMAHESALRVTSTQNVVARATDDFFFGETEHGLRAFVPPDDAALPVDDDRRTGGELARVSPGHGTLPRAATFGTLWAVAVLGS
jgi:hypothetical protein